MGRKEKYDGALPIYSVVNEVTEFLHGPAPSAIKIQGDCYTGAFNMSLVSRYLLLDITISIQAVPAFFIVPGGEGISEGVTTPAHLPK